LIALGVESFVPYDYFMEENPSRWTRRLTGGLATTCTIAAFVLQFYGSWATSTLPSWSWVLIVLSLGLFLHLFIFQDDTVRFRWRVLSACKRIKEIADESIDIAAGDCSWLAAEIAVLQRQLDDGKKIRLLCRPGVDATTNRFIAEIAAHSNAEVRHYPPDFAMHLRCIIIDRMKPNAGRVVLIDKERPASRILGVFTPPDFLRRDHSLTHIRPGSKAYSLLQLVFDAVFAQGSPAPSAQKRKP
jgi:hypothetical protein